MVGDFMPLDGEVARAIRSKRWSDTALGPLETWPEALRTAVSICLGSTFPMLVCWGPDLLQLYNDAALAILRTKHPRALGRSARETWAELWPDVGPLIERLMLTGEPASGVDMPLFPAREGAREQAFFTFSLSAIRGCDGRPAGMFVVVTETTAKVRAERERALAEQELLASDTRQAFLLQLGDRLQDLTDAEEMTAVTAELLGRHLNVNRVVYGEMDADGEHTLVWSDWTDGTVPSAKGRYRLGDFGPDLAQSYRRGEIRRTDDTEAGASPNGDRSLGIRAAIGVPMLKAGRLVAGMSVHSTSPRRWTDSEVRLVREVGERIWSSIERARSEAALRAREEKYRTLIESMDEAFCVIELLVDESGAPADALHVEVNPAYTKHTGLSDVVGKRASELLSEVSPHWVALYAQAIEKGKPIYLQDYSSAVDRWFDVRIVRVGPPSMRQVAVLFSDVTLRRRAEEELRRAAERDAFRIVLADALGPLADPLEIQEAATRILGQRLGASRVHYAETSNGEALVRRDYAAAGVPSVAGAYALGKYSGFFYSEVEAGRTCVSDDVSTDPRLSAHERAAILGDFGMRARASVPLVKGDILRGMLSVQFAEPHAFRRDEVDLIEETAERTWAALERARTEAALRQSEERFRSIVHSASDYAIFLTDARGIITEWPEGAERVKGYTAAEVIGQPISLFYTPEDVAAGEPERELAEAAREGRVERETVRVRKGGERFWVNEIATPVRDPKGQLIGFTRIARDITKKTQAAESLRQLAEADAFRITLADALRALSDPVETQAVASRVLGQHLGATRVVYSEIHGDTSIVHRDYTDGSPSLRGVHPLAAFDTFFREQSQAGVMTVLDDVSSDPRLPASERRAVLAYGIAAMVSVPLVKDGELRATLDVQQDTPRKWTSAELARIGETAERTWLAVDQARTETLLRSSEERFRQALDIETVGVVFFDLKGGIIRANDAFCRMTGYTQADIEEQRLYFESLSSPDSIGVRTRALEELEKVGSAATYEQQCVRKDGSTFWGLFAAKRLGSKQAVEFILDITERKCAEEALAKAHAELEERVTRRTLELALTNNVLKNEVAQRRQAERLRTDLLRRLDSAQEDERRRVSRDLHDQVGQTLTALTLAVRATRDAGALPAPVSARLSDVQRAAEELGREVHELAVRLRPTALDDLGLHAALGQLLSDWSARTRIEVDCQLADLEAARLPPDFETVLYRVVQEALTNVARHARAARASVVVQRVNGCVIAVVEDDGVGFEPRSTSTDRLGLLGLSERVTLAGGTLSIESATGQGTTLIARLPC